jgi:transcription initiation factor TFIIE subunit alpha
VSVTKFYRLQLSRTPDYDQYYASLAASGSSNGTPAMAGAGSDFGDEEEDIKPNIEYLNSLNDYRKRSRSQEDNGLVDTKRLRGSSSDVHANGVASIDEGDVDEDMEGVPPAPSADGPPSEDTIVYGVYLDKAPQP